MTAELELTTSTRILARTRADIEVRCLRDGKPATPSGPITYTVTDGDANEIAAGTATIAESIIRITLTAAQNSRPNVLTVALAGIVFADEPAVSFETEVESIGAWLFTLDEAREFDGGKLGSEAQFSVSAVLTGRDRITQQIEKRVGISPGARYAQEFLDGDLTNTLLLQRTRCRALRAVSIRTYGGPTWTALTEDELAACQLSSRGLLTREGGTWPRGTGNIRVSYEHGIQPIPYELTRAALLVLKFQMTATDVLNRATSVTNQQGTYSLATPGLRGSYFGIPEADEILHQYHRPVVGIA